MLYFKNCRCFCKKQQTQVPEYSRHHSILEMTFFLLFTPLTCNNVQNVSMDFRSYPLTCLLPTLQTHLRQLLTVTSQSQSPTASSELRIFLRWWCGTVFQYWQCRYFCWRGRSCGASLECWSACRNRSKWATLQNDEKDCYGMAVGLSESHLFFEKDKKIALTDCHPDSISNPRVSVQLDH